MPSGVKWGPPSVKTSQLGASSLGPTVTSRGKLAATLATASSTNGCTTVMGLPQVWLPGPRSMVSSSMFLTLGYLLLMVFTVLVRAAVHSSTVFHSQLTPMNTTRSGLALFFTQGETIFSDQTGSLGSAQRLTKAWLRVSACHRA